MVNNDPFGLQSYRTVSFPWDWGGCEEGPVIQLLRRYLEVYGMVKLMV